MINKQKLWFLTLFSIILVLSVYYVSMPGESLSNLIKSNDTSSEKTTIKTNSEDNLAALRVSNDEEVLAEMAKLQETLLDTAASSEDKNNAYEKLLSINITATRRIGIIKKLILCTIQYQSSTAEAISATAEKNTPIIAITLFFFINAISSNLNNNIFLTYLQQDKCRKNSCLLKIISKSR